MSVGKRWRLTVDVVGHGYCKSDDPCVSPKWLSSSIETVYLQLLDVGVKGKRRSNL